MVSSRKRAARGPATSKTESEMQSTEAIPPSSHSDRYGAVDHQALGTNAQVAADGRVNINIKQPGNKLSNLLDPLIQQGLKGQPKDALPAHLVGKGTGPVPRLNIVIQVVGSRGDVQPFIALGRALEERFGHHVRLATHPAFRKFVEENHLEFFSVGGDPAELMAFMVKNPGLMPGMSSLRDGDIGRRRKEIAEIVSGCWRSCFEDGDGTGPPISDADLPDRCPTQRPFIADIIIANPPSFAHIHCAEKLGIPLHIMFTMPWTPTQSFPHPLANIEFSNTEVGVANLVSYALVEILTWQGLGDVINKFREKSLGLEPVNVMWAPWIVPRLRIPHTYCWSPVLLQKPRDWGANIDIAGYFFLPSESDYKPPDGLVAFLESGPPPIYIGFGSIVVEDPNGMTQLIFEAVKKTGQRAIVSKGWGGIGAEELGVPDNVFMADSCPHDWLFERVSCVVHHGGAGTTAIGIACGKPTVIVPFFGDQTFWGSIVAKAEAGPAPIPHKQLTADNLAEAIQFALKPNIQKTAQGLAAKIRAENGVEAGVESFHKHLHADTIRCMFSPSRCAVWRIKKTKIRLSAFAATTLSNEGILDLDDLRLYRPREYDLELGPIDPVTGGATAILGSIAEVAIGVADIPAEILRTLPFPPFSASKSDQTEESTGASRKSTDTASSGRRRSLSAASSIASSVVSSSSMPPTQAGGSGKGHKGDTLVDAASGESSASYCKEKAKDVSTITSSSVIAATDATARLVLAGLKSPMNLAMGIARGFHNAPKLYHDRTVRTQEKITGFQSGIKAAGKEFGYGFYDAISGVVTQPLRERSRGATGVMKGIGKGLGGLVLKPGAGIFALAGYTLNGVYKEVQKLFGTSVECYMVACRSKQGYDEWQQATQDERSEVLQRWYSLGVELESKAVQTPFAKEWERAASVLLESKEAAKRALPRREPPEAKVKGQPEKAAPGKFEEALRKAAHLLSDLTRRYQTEEGRSPVEERDAAMDEAAEAASLDAVDEEIFQQALRESVAEFRRAETSGDSANAYDRAIKAAVDAARGATGSAAARPSGASAPASPTRHAHTPEGRLQRLSLGDEGRVAVADKNCEGDATKPDHEGADDVAQYAIWRSLTERGQYSEKRGASG